jgi:hypothetical protein
MAPYGIFKAIEVQKLVIKSRKRHTGEIGGGGSEKHRKMSRIFLNGPRTIFCSFAVLLQYFVIQYFFTLAENKKFIEDIGKV